MWPFEGLRIEFLNLNFNFYLMSPYLAFPSYQKSMLTQSLMCVGVSVLGMSLIYFCIKITTKISILKSYTLIISVSMALKSENGLSGSFI